MRAPEPRDELERVLHFTEPLQRIIAIDAFGTDPAIVREAPVKPTSATLILWPSGIKSIQRKAGGLYGSSLIGGSQKLGKSMSALRSSILAALDGWVVPYFDCENDYDEVMRRTWNVLGDRGSDALAHWHPWFVRRAASLETVATCAAQSIVKGDERVLIVIDSLNRLAKRMERHDKRYQRGNGYFRAIVDICDWAQSCTMLSEGRVGVLLTSELNRGRTIVGMDPEYACQVVVYLREGKEDGIVDIQMLSRRTPGGDLGAHIRRFSRCEFVPMDGAGDEEENWWDK